MGAHHTGPSRASRRGDHHRPGQLGASAASEPAAHRGPRRRLRLLRRLQHANTQLGALAGHITALEVELAALDLEDAPAGRLP